MRGCVVSVRRYLAVIQDPRGYADELEPAPPEGPIPVVVHTVVLLDDYKQVKAERDRLQATLDALTAKGGTKS